MNQLLFPDDTPLGHIPYRNSRKMRQDGLTVSLNGEGLEELKCPQYLGEDVTADGTMGAELCYRMRKGAKVLSAFWSLWKERSVSVRVKTGMFEGTVIPTVLYGCGIGPSVKTGMFEGTVVPTMLYDVVLGLQ